MTKSRERSEASYSTSRAEEMAKAFSMQHEELLPISAPYVKQADIDLAVQLASKSGYLAGMKAMSDLVKAWASECAEYADDAKQRQIGEKLKRFIDKTMGQDG